MASDDLAFIAHFLDRRTYLHNLFLSVNVPCSLYLHPAAGVCLLSHAQRFSFHVFTTCQRRFAPAVPHAKTPQGAKTHNFCIISSQTYAETACLFEPIGNAPTLQIIYRQLNRNPISREDLDVMHPHLPGNMSQDIVPVLELNPKHCVWQRLEYCPLELDNVLFGQILFLRKKGH